MKVLFVCLGNICRSPMAEYIMRVKCADRNLDWEIASAATENYHVGEPADERGVRTAKKRGLDMSRHIARQFSRSDFDRYDIIYSMATDVTFEISLIAHDEVRMKKVHLFMDALFPGQQRSVPDPWRGNEKDFEMVFDLVESICEKIIQQPVSLPAGNLR